MTERSQNLTERITELEAQLECNHQALKQMLSSIEAVVNQLNTAKGPNI